LFQGLGSIENLEADQSDKEALQRDSQCLR